MPETITVNSKIPFGRPGRFGNRGKRIRECSDSFLRWMSEELIDSDFASYALAAREVIGQRAITGQAMAKEDDLEAQADAILRRAGFGTLVPRHKRRAQSKNRA